jgi:hypothetical protein
MSEWDRILTGIDKAGYPNLGPVACSGILPATGEGEQERVFKASGVYSSDSLLSSLGDGVAVERGSARAT